MGAVSLLLQKGSFVDVQDFDVGGCRAAAGACADMQRAVAAR
jgi:hypothetical protein